MIATRITYAARIANKGNVRAITVPTDVIEEMGLSVGEMVQITIEKIPKE